MLKNDTLKNGMSHIGLYGSALTPGYRLASSPSLEIAKVDISSSTRQGDPFGWRTGKERDLSNTSVLKIDHC